MNILTDEEINAIWSEPLETSKLSPFGLARIQAIIDATVKALAAGVSVEPEFKWCSVLQALPEENTYVMVCFGVDVVEGSYGSGLWLSLAHGEAQPDYWAYHPKPPHQLNTAIAAARVQAINECISALVADDKTKATSAEEAVAAIRALIEMKANRE